MRGHFLFYLFFYPSLSWQEHCCLLREGDRLPWAYMSHVASGLCESVAIASPSFVGSTSFSRSLPILCAFPLHPDSHAWDPDSPRWNAHREHIFWFKILMKWSQIYLTAVFICDLLVTPERSHSPSISCGHRKADQLSLSKSLRLVLPGALASRGCDHQTTTNLTDQSDSWLHQPIATSIRKSVYGLESCRHNGNILWLCYYISCSCRGGWSPCAPHPFSFPNLHVCPGI